MKILRLATAGFLLCSLPAWAQSASLPAADDGLMRWIGLALLAVVMLLAYRAYWLQRQMQRQRETEARLHQSLDQAQETIHNCRQNENKLQELTARLSQSEALYRLLTEDALDVIWKTDDQLRITYISPSDERLRGYRADEVLGHHVFEMFTEEGIATVTKLLKQRQTAATDQAKAAFVTFEVQHRCKDGRLLWGEVLSRPERDANGNITGHHGITRESTERKQLQDQVRQLAFYDPLTQLPNRRLLNDRLNKTIAASQRYQLHAALMILDLDNFKSLNDTHGHLAGDALLQEAAQRLSACVREVDTVARFGGDEFVVLLSSLDAAQPLAHAQAANIAEKIRLSLSAPYLLKVNATDQGSTTSVQHRCTASIGVVVFLGHQYDPDSILKWADAAMYQAKDGGRNRVCFKA